MYDAWNYANQQRGALTPREDSTSRRLMWVWKYWMEFLVSSYYRMLDLVSRSFEGFGLNFFRKLLCFTRFLSSLRTQPELNGLAAISSGGTVGVSQLILIGQFQRSEIFLMRLLQWVEHVLVCSFFSKISLFMEASLYISSLIVSSWIGWIFLVDFCRILGLKKILFLGEGCCLRLVSIQPLMSQSTIIFLSDVTLSSRRFSIEFQRLIIGVIDITIIIRTCAQKGNMQQRLVHKFIFLLPSNTPFYCIQLSLLSYL